jgi:hypothetical protein
MRKARREQAILRGSLGIGTGDSSRLHTCGLCGRDVPESLIVAAHIKPRRECSEAERLDIPAIAIPACLLGCDALFEHGFITVGRDGTVIANGASSLELEHIAGRQSVAWNDARE